MDSLQSQAREKERIFQKAKHKGKAESLFYHSVLGVIGVCKRGMWKDPSHRLTASALEKEIRQWVDRGLGTRRPWCCGADLGVSSLSVAGADLRSERREGSVRAASLASFDIQLPIERPMSFTESISTDDTGLISPAEEDISTSSGIHAGGMFLADAEEDWPLRRESRILAEKYKSLPHSRYTGRSMRTQPRPMGGVYDFA